MVKEELVKHVERLVGKGGVIALGSFGHGHGRSYVKKHIEGILRERYGERIVSISTGDIFREEAKKRGFDDIGEFVNYLKKNPEIAIEIDNAIDRRVSDLIRKHVEEGKIVLIDSNIFSHPEVLEKLVGDRYVSIFIHTPEEVMGKRLTATQRKGERSYSSEREAVVAQLKRTLMDIARYEELARKTKDPHLRMLYRIAAEKMKKFLRVSRIWFRERTPPRKYQEVVLPELKRHRMVVVDNSGHVEETLRKVVEELSRLE